MSRTIKIQIDEHARTGAPMTAEEYTDLANALWMVLRTTPFRFSIEPDRHADIGQMNNAWAQYGEDAQWGD